MMNAFDFLHTMMDEAKLAEGYRIDSGEIVFPTGETAENGKPIYFSVKVGFKSTKDTKRGKAFDLDEAVTAYEEKQKEKLDKASKPKKDKPAPASAKWHKPVVELIGQKNEAMTAPEIADILEDERGVHPSWNIISAACKAIVKVGMITRTEKDGKAAYTLQA